MTGDVLDVLMINLFNIHRGIAQLAYYGQNVLSWHVFNGFWFRVHGFTSRSRLIERRILQSGIILCIEVSILKLKNKLNKYTKENINVEFLSKPMVLIIKSKGDQANDYSRIAAQMINMETNQTVYDDNASSLYPDTKETKRPKFNIYNSNSVEFDFTLKNGIVVLYLKSNISYTRHDHAMFITEEIQKLNLPVNFTETISNKSDYYTLAKSEITVKTTRFEQTYNSQKFYRKITTDPYCLKKIITSNTAHFVWLIIIKNADNFRGSQLFIHEMDPTIPSEVCLNKSICTIIYDDIDMINNQETQKQLNYPSLNQYRMFSQNQIIVEPIYISWTGGLCYEIYYQFTGKTPKYNRLDLAADGENFIGECSDFYKLIMPYLEFKDLKLKRLNPEKSWKTQLLEHFDYEKQEDDEINLKEEGKPEFPNDICFISKIPLWDKFYVIRIKNETCEFDIAIAPPLVHGKFRMNKVLMGFKEYLSWKNGKISMLSLRICSHPRTLIQVLDMLPNPIHPIKKHIMRCMELYGAYSKSNDSGNSNSFRYSRNYYVMDKITNQIYVGVKSCNDTHITLYQNTNTILFRIIVVETSRTHDSWNENHTNLQDIQNGDFLLGLGQL